MCDCRRRGILYKGWVQGPARFQHHDLSADPYTMSALHDLIACSAGQSSGTQKPVHGPREIHSKFIFREENELREDQE